MLTVNSGVMNIPNFCIVDDLSKKYLVLKLNRQEAENIIDYQIHMISLNRRNNIVPFRVCRKDNDTCLYYDITGLMPLEDLMNTRKFTKQDLIKLLKDIIDCVLSNTDLLLYENGYVFVDRYFYMNPDTDTVCAVYIPIHRDINFNLALKEFLISLFAKVKIIDLEENDAFVKKITALVKQQNFNLYDFRKFLKNESIEEGSALHPINQKCEENIQLIKDKSSRHDNVVSKGIIDLKESIIKKKSAEGKNIKFNIKGRENEGGDNPGKHPDLQCDGGKSHNIESKVNEIDVNKNQNIKEHGEDNNKNKPSVLLLAVAIQLAVILWSVIIERFLNERGVNSALRYSIIAILIILIDIVAFKNIILNKCFKNINESSMPVNDRQDNEIMPGADACNEETMHDSDNIYIKEDYNKSVEEITINESDIMNNEKQNTSIEKWDTNKNIKINMSEPIDFNNGETTLLVYKNTVNAYLVPDNEEDGARYKIDQETFLIGRNSDICNMVIKKMVIGRVHAQIKFKDNSFYLIDKGSINGTALNGEKLQAEEEYKLNNGDLIEFANLKYKFIC